MYLLILGQGPKDLFILFRTMDCIFHSLMIKIGFSLVIALHPSYLQRVSPRRSPRRKRKQAEEGDSSPSAKRSIHSQSSYPGQ